MPETENSEMMIPIAIEEFVSGVKTPTDLYIRLADDKYILVTRSGSLVDPEQMVNYQSKAVEYVWVKRSDLGRLTQMAVAVAGVAVNSKNLSPEQKTRIVTAATNSVFRSIDHLGISVDTYRHARQSVEATVILVESHNNLSALLTSLSDCSEPLLRHSMAVSTLSVLIGQELGWENSQTLEKLALGGLLHDIGKKHLPKEILEKPLYEMTSEEAALYETHPFKGLRMLRDLNVVPDDVISIVYEHHENSIGQGFPQRLRNLRIHPLARVVGLANTFANLTLKSPAHPHPKTAEEALDHIEKTMGQPFNKEVFLALKNLVTAGASHRAA